METTTDGSRLNLSRTSSFKFRGIEGLRGWLACTVMFYHVIWFSGLYLKHSRLFMLQQIADDSVVAFIIISGFVITHLLLSRPENYKIYLARRFLRIYPVYFLCLCLGIFTTYLNFHTFSAHPWGVSTPPTDRLMLQYQSLSSGGLIPHLLAHVTLLQGVISNRVLYESEYMFLAPAWSLSLEWQFYLVAPLLIYLIGRSELSRVLLSLVAVFAFVAYQKGTFGSFIQPSLLPGAVLPFAVGITTRLIIYRLPRATDLHLAVALIASLFVLLAPRILPFYGWAVFVAWMLLEKPSTPSTARINRVFVLMLDSKLARYVGDISYPIYLAHAPVLQLLGYLCVVHLRLGMFNTLIFTLVTVPVSTFVIAGLIHKYVERPFIDLGKSLKLAS